MKSAVIVLLFAVVLLFSCQKEVHFANGNNGGPAGASLDVLLIKTVEKSGSDSVVNTYAYDDRGRLSSFKNVGTDYQGNDLNLEYHIHRNSSGIITDYSMIDPSLFPVGIDSVRTIVHSSGSRYTSYVINITVPGFELLDSAVFIYDGAGRVIGENDYQSPSATGQDYYLMGKITYSYSANGNLNSFVYNEYNQLGSNIYSYSTSNIVYDSKINPLHFGNEAFVLGYYPEWFSSNNITSKQTSDSVDPSDDQSIATTYTYNNSGRPETSVTTVMPGNTVINTAYYYQ